MFNLDWLLISSALTNCAQLARIICLAFFTVFLLHDHHRVVDLEKVISYLGCVRISTQIDCCCCFEHRLFLPLGL